METLSFQGSAKPQSSGGLLDLVGMGISDFLGGWGSDFWSGKAEDRAWERQKKIMRNKHQWEVQDLRAAGLNPLLSVTKGIGGSSPGVSIPGRAPAGRMDYVAAKRVQAETDLLQAQASTERMRALMVGNQGDMFSAQASESRDRARLVVKQMENEVARKPGITADALLKEYESKLYKALEDQFGELGAPSSAKGMSSAINQFIQLIIRGLIMKGK